MAKQMMLPGMEDLEANAPIELPGTPINIPGVSPQAPATPALPARGEADPFSELRKAFRWGEFVRQPKSDRTTKAALKLVLETMKLEGMPPEAIAEVQKIGTSIFGKGSPSKSLSKLLDPEHMDSFEQTLGLARAAGKGYDDKAHKKVLKSLLSQLQKDGVDPQILGEIKKVGVKGLAAAGPARIVQALGERGPDPMIASLVYKASGKAPTPQLAEVFKNVATEEVPALQGAAGRAAGKATTKALSEAGTRGFTTGSKTLRAAKLVPKLGTALGIIGGITSAKQAYDLLVGNDKMARAAAMSPVTATNQPLAPMDMIRQILGEKEAIARRKVVMNQYEPELTQQVLRSLAGSPAPSSLGSSEFALGTVPQKEGMKSTADVSKLLDALLAEMGK